MAIHPKQPAPFSLRPAKAALHPLLLTILQAVATLTLAITFIAAGLAVCCLPQTTGLLAKGFSGRDNPSTPFSHDSLVQAAGITRAYTLGECDTGALFNVIHTINVQANTPFANAESAVLQKAPEAFTLNKEALSHLDDVRTVILSVRIPLMLTALVAALLCVFIGIFGNKPALGDVLRRTGILVIGLFAALLFWAAIDFNSFFAVFHSFFFARGTWTFSQDSLLITMYPLAFWMGMGVVWLTTSTLVSIAAFLAGKKLRRASVPSTQRKL